MKKIEPICKNCKIFIPEKSQCGVTIIHEGQYIKMPVDPNDRCFFENKWFNPITKETEEFNEEIKELRVWEKDGKVHFEEPQ